MNTSPIVLIPFKSFEWSVRVLDNDFLSNQRISIYEVLRTLLLNENSLETFEPPIQAWYTHERALLAYQQTVCYEWSIVRGYVDDYWDLSRKLFLNVIKNPIAVPLIPPKWLGDADLHISHQSYLLNANQDHYRKHFPGIKNDHPLIFEI